MALVTANYFRSPLFAVLLSYQLNWILFYGQVDAYVVFGIALGYHAIQRSRPFLIGVAISLLMIKPQIGLLLSLYFLWRSPYRLKTFLALLLIVLASLALWPGWPERYVLQQLLPFLGRPYNILTNTSLGLPLWAGLPIAVLALLLPTSGRQKIQVLVAATLLVSPYSTIYSHLSLLCLGLPVAFYIFAVVPWAVGILLGPFGYWQWGFLFPLSVLAYTMIVNLSRRPRPPSIAEPREISEETVAAKDAAQQLAEADSAGWAIVRCAWPASMRENGGVSARFRRAA